MLGLYRRELRQEGCYVTTSLIANGVWSNSCVIAAELCNAQFHPRRPRSEAMNFTSLYYKAGCGRVFKLCIVDIEIWGMRRPSIP